MIRNEVREAIDTDLMVYGQAFIRMYVDENGLQDYERISPKLVTISEAPKDHHFVTPQGGEIRTWNDLEKHFVEWLPKDERSNILDIMKAYRDRGLSALVFCEKNAEFIDTVLGHAKKLGLSKKDIDENDADIWTEPGKTSSPWRPPE